MINVFGTGLSIAHYGTIEANENSKIGKDCGMYEGVTIGANSVVTKNIDECNIIVMGVTAKNK